MCEQPFDTIELDNGYIVEIYGDDYPESPREWCNLGVMVCWHNRYTLGDENPKYPPKEYFANMVSDYISEADYDEAVNRWCDSVEDDTMRRINAQLDKHYIMLELHVYEHGGITMRTSPFYDPWDSGQVGFIYVPIADVKKEWGWKRLTAKRREQIESILKSEVEIYDDYLTGNVYGYKLIDPDGLECDSCWGFYGYNHEKSRLLESAKEMCQ